MFDKKEYMKNYRREHAERIRRYKSEYRITHQKEIKEYYEKKKVHFRAYQQDYRQNHKEQYNKRSRKYKATHKEVIKAENQARYRIPLGNQCSKCGTTENLVRHHPDYSRPLEVVTLCHTCNINERILGETDK